jgi:hypothetical protein
VGRIQGNVIVANVSNVRGAKAVRNQGFFYRKVRELNNVRTRVIDDGD